MKTVILDYGHGGIDPTGQYTTAPNKMYKFDNGRIAYEGMLNRLIGWKVRDILQAQGVKVVETAPSFTDYSLAARVNLANAVIGQKIFVSIHNNASSNHKARGFEIFSSKGKTISDDLAKAIHKELAPVITANGSKDRGIKEEDFFVLKKTNHPAVLIEVLFFDNWDDFVLLENETFQDAVAEAIAKGIKNSI